MEELRRLLEELLDARLLGIVLSAPRQKESYRRIRIRALDCRGALRFQAAFWDGKKEFHKNYEKEALIPELLVWMSHDYRQLQAESTQYTASVLVSKKGTVTVKKKARATEAKQADMTHNRTKQYLLPEGEPVPFLVKLGVMTPEGKVVKAKYDKFRQINRFLEFIEDITPVLAKDREIKNEVLQPVLRYGLLKERMAALITDGLRASMLEEQGYRVQVLEFIDMEHTPKNILLRAIKEPEKIRRGDAAGKQEELERCMASLHVTPTLEKLLRGACRKG